MVAFGHREDTFASEEEMMTDIEKPIYNVKSAARFADILEFVAGQPNAPKFADIVDGLGLPKSSLFNLIGTMIARDYLSIADSGGYRIGPKIARLANQIGSGASYATKSRPVISRLTDQINETCGYYELRGDEAEVVWTDSGRQAFGYSLKLGDRAPLYCVSSGKVLLAHLTAREIDGYLGRITLKRFTDNTVRSRDALEQELDEIRTTGFAYSREEYSLGIIGIATPVEIHGRVVGALSIALPTVRFNPEMDGRIKRALSLSASEMERGL